MAQMKAWHVTVLNGWKTIEDHMKFSVKEARELEVAIREKYAVVEDQPETKVFASYAIKREYY